MTSLTELCVMKNKYKIYIDGVFGFVLCKSGADETCVMVLLREKQQCYELNKIYCIFTLEYLQAHIEFLH